MSSLRIVLRGLVEKPFISRLLAVLIVFLGISVRTACAQQKTVAERLGYPADAKLLIIHGDDLAVAHSVDRATFNALDHGAITSASVMVPCPWLTDVAAYVRLHPAADIGIHLALTSEWKTYRWGSVAPADQVPSLLDPDGYFWSETGLAVRHDKPEEVEREIRAQIERARLAGIRPTHLDMHMAVLGQTPELFAIYAKVARENRLPFLAVRLPAAPPKMLAQLRDTDVVLDSLVMAQHLPEESWMDFYARALKSVKPGLNEIIVHLGYEDAELVAVAAEHPDFGAAWRQRDYDAVTSPQFKKLLEDTRITLLGWKDVKRILSGP